MKIATIILVISATVVAALVFISGTTSAQLPETFVVFDGYQMYVPEDWQTWRYTDYSSETEGLAAIAALYVSESAYPPELPQLDNLRFFAAGPRLENGSLATLLVRSYRLSEIAAENGLAPDVISPVAILASFNYSIPYGLAIGGRKAAIGVNTYFYTYTDRYNNQVTSSMRELVLAEIFPDLDSFVTVTVTGIEKYDVPFTIFSSLRLVGEPLDTIAWNFLVNGLEQSTLTPSPVPTPTIDQSKAGSA